MGSESRLPAWAAGEQAARSLRFEFGRGHGPIDVYDVIAQRGVALAFRDLEGDDGRYIFYQGRGLIIVNATCEEAARQRFTAAHELGHHEMHRFGEESERDTYLVDRNVFDTGKVRREVEANAFAAYLLLPTEAIREECDPTADLGVDTVLDLMARYGTSYETTVNRLNNARRITAVQRDALKDEGRGRIRALRGEVETPMGPRAPSALERSLAKLYLAGLVDAERVGASLGVTPGEVVDRYGDPEPAGAGAASLLAELSASDE